MRYPLDYAFTDKKLGAFELSRLETFAKKYLAQYAGPLVEIVDDLKLAVARAVQLVSKGLAVNAAQQVDLECLANTYRALESELPAHQLLAISPVELVRGLRPAMRHEGVFAGENIVRYLRFHPFNFNKPVAVLDATGDQRIYRHIFPGHEFEVDEANAKMEAEVWQIYDQALPVRSLRREAKVAEIRALIGAVLQRREALLGKGIAVIGRKEIVERLKLPEDVKTSHYWGNRGSRDFEDCHTMILVGAAEPDFKEVELKARLIFGRNVCTERVPIRRPYGKASSPGKSWGTEILTPTPMKTCGRSTSA